jgi:dTDP-L-rhamnose 4-epimerase
VTGDGAVLVTGGAGFIGSHIVDRLLAQGRAVHALDNLDPAAHDGPPAWCASRAEWTWGDVRDADVWRRLLPRSDAVCHQAAKVGLGQDFGDVLAYVEANDVGFAVGLSVMHDLGWTGRIVLASSMVVYGEGTYCCQRHGAVRPGPRSITDLDAGRFDPPCPACGEPLEPGLVDETAPTDPRNVYAATKLHQEHLGAAFEREHQGVTVTMLRYHNVYGPRMPQATPYAGVASIFRSALAQGQAPRLLEDGRQRRDFVHVADVARANVIALTRQEPVPGVFNVASGRPATLWEMADALCAGHGSGIRPQVVGGYRLGDVRHVSASTERAAEVLGFRAEVPLTDGMAEFAHVPQRRPPLRR